MKTIGTKLLVASLGALLVTGSTQAAGIDSDDASAGVYGDGWQNFDDGS